MKCCAIIPAYREAERIANVVRRVQDQGVTAVVVDDGSPDATAEVAKQAGATVVQHETNKGKGEALASGFRFAMDEGYEVVITLDADGQHDPVHIPDFLRAFEETGLSVLVGNRMADTTEMPLVRRWTNQFMSWLLSRMMNQVVPDTQNGYRLYRADVLPYIRTESAGFAAESEQLLYLAERDIEIGSVPVSTIYGDEKSKIDPVGDTILFFKMLHRHKKSRRQGIG